MAVLCYAGARVGWEVGRARMRASACLLMPPLLYGPCLLHGQVHQCARAGPTSVRWLACPTCTQHIPARMRWPPQVCTGAEHLHPDAACLLHPEELELYSASRKGRQLAANRLIQLLGRAKLDTGNQVSLDVNFSRAIAAVNTCVVIKFQARARKPVLCCRPRRHHAVDGAVAGARRPCPHVARAVLPASVPQPCTAVMVASSCFSGAPCGAVSGGCGLCGDLSAADAPDTPGPGAGSDLPCSRRCQRSRPLSKRCAVALILSAARAPILLILCQPCIGARRGEAPSCRCRCRCTRRLQHQDATGDPADRMAVVFSTCSLMLVTMFVNLLVLGVDETATALQGGACRDVGGRHQQRAALSG